MIHKKIKKTAKMMKVSNKTKKKVQNCKIQKVQNKLSIFYYLRMIRIPRNKFND